MVNWCTVVKAIAVLVVFTLFGVEVNAQTDTKVKVVLVPMFGDDAAAKWRGTWADATEYKRGDLVEDRGSSFIARSDHLSEAGTNDPENDADDGGTTDYWDLVAEKGADGIAGPTGPAATVEVYGTQTVPFSNPAEVINQGTSENASLEFIIPKGQPGPEGPEGPVGPQGSPADAVAAVCTALGYRSTCNLETSLLPRYELGDIGPAGGLVVRVTDNGRHGLEAAPDVVNKSEQFQWGCWGISIPTSTSIGTGYTNTVSQLGACLDPVFDSFEAANNYPHNGYAWFLPSIDELALYFSVSGGPFQTIYWSSSESSANFAWAYITLAGGSAIEKTQTAFVLPFREF